MFVRFVGVNFGNIGYGTSFVVSPARTVTIQKPTKWYHAKTMYNQAPMIWTDRLTGNQWSIFTRPCIYGWSRYQVGFLYIGSSMNGIGRVLCKEHHVIGIRDAVLPGDTISLFFPPIKDEKELRNVEKLYIRRLNPAYNTIRYSTVESMENELVEEERPPKIEELTNAAYPDFELSEFNNDVTELSIEELQERLAKIRQSTRAVDQLNKLTKK